MSKLVKLNIKNKSGEEFYFISSEMANRLLSSDLQKPIAVNGLIKYVGDTDAEYRRLAITSFTEFSLERAVPEDVEGYL